MDQIFLFHLSPPSDFSRSQLIAIIITPGEKELLTGACIDRELLLEEWTAVMGHLPLRVAKFHIFVTEQTPNPTFTPVENFKIFCKDISVRFVTFCNSASSLLHNVAPNHRNRNFHHGFHFDIAVDSILDEKALQDCTLIKK